MNRPIGISCNSTPGLDNVPPPCTSIASACKSWSKNSAWRRSKQPLISTKPSKKIIPLHHPCSGRVPALLVLGRWQAAFRACQPTHPCQQSRLLPGQITRPTAIPWLGGQQSGRRSPEPMPRASPAATSSSSRAKQALGKHAWPKSSWLPSARGARLHRSTLLSGGDESGLWSSRHRTSSRPEPARLSVASCGSSKPLAQ